MRRIPGTVACALALAAAALSAGCSGDSSVAPSSSDQRTLVVPEVVDMTGVNGLSLVDRNDTMLVFAITGWIPTLPVGHIIVGSEDGGYLGRIAAVRRSGWRLFVTTTPAYVSDAVVFGGAETTVPLRFGSTIADGTVECAGPLRLVDAAPGVSVSGEGLDLAGVVIHDGPVLGGELSAVITSGRIVYEPSLDLAVGIAPKAVSDFRAVLAGGFTVEFDALIETSGPCEAIEGVTIASLSRDVVMRIGTFPVAARVTLRYLASISLRGGFAGACSFHGSAAGTLGFGAVRAGGHWVERLDDGIVFAIPGLALPDHEETRITIAVWPVFDVAFYGEESVEAYRKVMHMYREWDSGAPVLEWHKAVAFYGSFSFAPGKLDERGPSYSALLSGSTIVLDEGPFKTSDYIFVGEWGVEGAGDGEFGYPKGIAVSDDGFVYVVDNLNSRVQKFTREGEFVSAWGSPGVADGQFDTPEKVAINDGGILYVADAGNRRIQRFMPDGLFISSWGREGDGDGDFRYPFGVAAGGGMVFVSDNISHRVQRFTQDGMFLSAWGSQGGGADQFDGPMGCAYAPTNGGRVVVCDCRNNRVGIFHITGILERWFGAAGRGDGAFDCPTDVAVDASGTIYVCDLGNERIQIFSSSGDYMTKLGSFGSAPGHFDHPESIAVDEQGTIYVADGRNHRVQKFARRHR